MSAEGVAPLVSEPAVTGPGHAVDVWGCPECDQEWEFPREVGNATLGHSCLGKSSLSVVPRDVPLINYTKRIEELQREEHRIDVEARWLERRAKRAERSLRNGGDPCP